MQPYATLKGGKVEKTNNPNQRSELELLFEKNKIALQKIGIENLYEFTRWYAIQGKSSSDKILIMLHYPEWSAVSKALNSQLY
jgi:hypothetical protein